MGKYVIQGWIFILILGFHGMSSPVQSQYLCSYRCFDPNLEVRVGDSYIWFATNYFLSSAIQSNNPNPQDRFLLSLEMRILKPLNNITRNQLLADESEYLLITGNVTEDGNNIDQELFTLTKLPVLLISPTLATDNNKSINTFVDRAMKTPVEEIGFIST